MITDSGSAFIDCPVYWFFYRKSKSHDLNNSLNFDNICPTTITHNFRVKARGRRSTTEREECVLGPCTRVLYIRSRSYSTREYSTRTNVVNHLAYLTRHARIQTADPVKKSDYFSIEFILDTWISRLHRYVKYSHLLYFLGEL